MKSLDELLAALPPPAHTPDGREVIVTVAEIHRFVRAAVAEEREAICEIIEGFRDLNDAEDGLQYPGLAEWEGEDDCGRWVINPDKLVELIRSRPA